MEPKAVHSFCYNAIVITAHLFITIVLFQCYFPHSFIYYNVFQLVWQSSFTSFRIACCERSSTWGEFYSLPCFVCGPWSPARILRFVVVCLHVVPNQESTQGLVGCSVLCDHKSVQYIWTSFPCKCCADFTHVGLKRSLTNCLFVGCHQPLLRS